MQCSVAFFIFQFTYVLLNFEGILCFTKLFAAMWLYLENDKSFSEKDFDACLRAWKSMCFIFVKQIYFDRSNNQIRTVYWLP